MKLQEIKVKKTKNFTTSIHVALKSLIEEKSKRDQINFTSSQLANALSMPRSMITKLTHTDHTKRVINPRIDTLLKIVDFFRDDGFNITVDDLLGKKEKSVDVQEQKPLSFTNSIKVNLFPFTGKSNTKLGTINIKVSGKSKNFFALRADSDIKPFFKKGSIFIIDEDQTIEDDTLVAAWIDKSKKFEIMKYHIYGHKRILKPLDNSEREIILLPTTQHIIAGIIIQINAKT